MRSLRRTLLSVTFGCILLVGGALTMPVASAAVDVDPVPAQDETEPVAHTGDTADDPAIWVDPQDHADSLVIGNDKGAGSPGALETYDLDGNRIQRIDTPSGFWGNVDLRQDAGLPGGLSNVVAVYRGGIRLYTVDADSRQLSPVTDGTGVVGPNSGEGLCMYHSGASGRLYVFTVTRTGGHVTQVELTDTDGDGLLAGSTVREFDVGSEAEGCVADDQTGALYLSEEDVALWRYGAEPTDGSGRTQVDGVESAGGRITPDVEGLTLTGTSPEDGYLIASAQNGADRPHSSFAVYERSGTNEYVTSFRITDGTDADDCDGTDGIAAYAGDLGPRFPDGIFVCQDNNNDLPGSDGNQDFKYADLGAILPTPPPPADQESSVTFVDADSANGNHRTHTVRTPAGVEAGDTLVLFMTTNTDKTLTPPDGWDRLEAVDEYRMRARAWTRTATSADAGTTVTARTDGYTKSDMTVAAYRADGGAAITASAHRYLDDSRTDLHTPPLTITEPGSWLISYWGARSTSGPWTPPPGQTTRAESHGNGGGPIDALLTDTGGPVPAGTHGNLTATVPDPVDRAATFSLALTPTDNSPADDDPPPADPPPADPPPADPPPPDDPADPPPDDPPPPPAASEDNVLLDFEGQTAGADALQPFTNRGTSTVDVGVVSANGGDVAPVAGRSSNAAIRLPAYAPDGPTPSAELAIQDTGGADDLEPGDRPFTFGADFRLDPVSDGRRSDDGDNLLQRGLWGGTQYKLQIENRLPSCVVHGSGGRVLLWSDLEVDATSWYHAECTRDGDRLTLSVGRYAAGGLEDVQTTTETDTIGDISYSGDGPPMSVGGKLDPDGTVSRATDQFNGLVDNAFYRLG